MRSLVKNDAAVGGILVGLASVQFGVVVVLGTAILRKGLGVTAMLGIRFLIAAIVLSAIAAARGTPLLPARGERGRLALLGVAGYSIESALFFAAIRHGTATAVTLLFFTYPVFVAVTSLLLGERAPGRLIGGALFCAVAGAAIVVAGSGRIAIRPAGMALALGAALMFTVYLIGVDRTMKRTQALTASAWVSAWASAGLFASLLVLPGRHVPFGGEWWRVVAMGICTGGAFFCLMAGLRRLGPVRTSIVAAAEPLSSSILAIVFLNESLRPATAAGGALILAGAIAASLARKQSRMEPELP